MLRSVDGFLLLCKPHRALPGHGVLAIFINANPFRASRLLFLPFALLRRATWHFRETVFHPNRLALSTTSRSNYQRIRLVALPFYALEPQLSNSSKLFHADIRYSRVSCNFFFFFCNFDSSKHRRALRFTREHPLVIRYDAIYYTAIYCKHQNNCKNVTEYPLQDIAYPCIRIAYVYHRRITYVCCLRFKHVYELWQTTCSIIPYSRLNFEISEHHRLSQRLCLSLYRFEAIASVSDPSLRTPQRYRRGKKTGRRCGAVGANAYDYFSLLVKRSESGERVANRDEIVKS